ncbi:MAG TPA: aminotransferase IV [Clostridiaceae bacterium]|nr:aminotransferase IV [Clostridiaceae bacterium]
MTKIEKSLVAEIDGRYYIIDEKTEKTEDFNILSMNIINPVYEVIRIINGIPLFMEDHYQRLINSSMALGIQLEYTQEYILRQIDSLLKLNEKNNCNVKIIIYSTESARDDSAQRFVCYISKSYYPDIETVRKGVPVSLIKLEREKPNVKILNDQYRQKVSSKIEEDGVFEVLLVNSDGKITEGSKSNVFFVKGEKVFTAPDSYVLKGITRKYILDSCRSAGVEVIEELVDVNSLENFDGVFLSGTSIKVLPVSRIDNMIFKSGTCPTIVAIRDEFDRLLEKYIQEHRQK